MTEQSAAGHTQSCRACPQGRPSVNTASPSRHQCSVSPSTNASICWEFKKDPWSVFWLPQEECFRVNEKLHSFLPSIRGRWVDEMFVDHKLSEETLFSRALLHYQVSPTSSADFAEPKYSCFSLVTEHQRTRFCQPTVNWARVTLLLADAHWSING